MKTDGKNKEFAVEGIGVAPGIAIGIAYIHEAGVSSVPEYCLPEREVQAECARFTEAAAEAGKQLARMQSKVRKMPGTAGEELNILLTAYQQMLKGSRLIRGVQRRIAEDRMNAEAAVQKEIGEIVEAFSTMEDSYLAARIEDIREVGLRLIRSLTKSQYKPFSGLPKDAVIIADELTPADTALLDPKLVVGLATTLGAKESHTAILARSFGIALVVSAHGLREQVRPNTPVILDGATGRAIVNPTPETLATYRNLQKALAKEQRELGKLRRAPAVTKDGVRISLMANVELPFETEPALRRGAEGVGLLRSEFMYMNRPDLPSEDEQYEAFRAVIETMDGRPVTVRTLDIGSDKVGDAIGVTLGPNPALGLRAIRLSLKHPNLLETQLAAIIRAGVHGPVRILLPMVTSAHEVRQVRDAMDKVAKRLKRRKVPIADPLPPLGAMVEVPSAALAADALAWECDFFALGTNDLTQYTLAIDRADEQVADIYDPLHPAVLRLIHFATEAALRARIPISICGEMAGDVRMTPLLVGLGIREFSMSSTSLGRVKRRIRAMDHTAAVQRARVIMEESEPARINELLDGFNT